MNGGRYALLIGNSTYSDPVLHKLRSPAQDVRGLKAVLEDPQIGQFNVTLLEDRSESEIRRALDVFFSKRSPDDFLLFYFSGHGAKDAPGRFYLTAVDTHTQYLRSTGISASFIHDVTQGSRARQKIMLLDACCAGAIVRGMTHRAGNRITREQIAGYKSGLAILTATDSEAYAFEGDQLSGESEPSVWTK